jgi:GNAT superfamily N-acetyltransferase
MRRSAADRAWPGPMAILGTVHAHSLGFRTDLMLRRLEGAEITDHGEYLVVRSPANPSFWWGNFLLLPEAALSDAGGDAGGRDRVATWIARFARAFPGAGHVALGIDTPSAGQDPADFLAVGFDLERNTVLATGAVREPPHPNRTASIRPLASDDDWHQSLELRLACSLAEDERFSGRDFLERRTSQARTLAQAGHGTWFGAFTGDRLAAQLGVFSDGAGIARYQGVETHPLARRQGLAGTLVWRAGAYALAALGARTLVIVADPGYSAIRVYRAAGFADREVQLSLQRAPG